MEAQADGPDSMWELYHAALRLRREHPALGDGPLTWLDDTRTGVLVFHRKAGFLCVVSLSNEPYQLLEHFDPGDQRSRRRQPTAPDQAAWLTL
ncbi:hypothetical protein ACYF6T_37940 [Streptomyces sp. 7R007]